MKGKLVIIDGPDGAGKSSGLEGLESWAVENGKQILDLRKFALKEQRLPYSDEISEYDVILSVEPTLAGIGKVIKQELIKTGSKFSGLSIAHAFALDRDILYKQVLIPALESGKLVFQERGVLTSFVYQPLQIHIPLKELMNLPGNRQALKYAPDLVIICTAEPQYLMSRLADNTQMFERLSFLRKVHQRFRSEWLRTIFSKFGTRFIYLDTSGTKEETRGLVKAKWEAFLNTAYQSV